jgi:hypothetical protein
MGVSAISTVHLLPCHHPALAGPALSRDHLASVTTQCGKVRHGCAAHDRLESCRKLGREQSKLDARVAGYVRAERQRAIRTFSRSLRARPDKRSGW